MRARLARLGGTLAVLAGRTVRSLPGVAAAACGVAGVDMLADAGWALIAASGYLLLLAVEVN